MKNTRESTETAQPLMVSRDEAARMFGVNVSTWDRQVAAGKTPAPVKFGGRTLFRLKDLKLWAELDCPKRTDFEALTQPRTQLERQTQWS